MKTILIVDDEMHPNGTIERRYGHLSEKDLAIKIKSFFESQSYQVQFAETGEDALAVIENDRDDLIKMVLLDIRFTHSKKITRMQGPEIFRKIREINGVMPIVVITMLPTRKLTGEEDIFREFVELGASLYMEKSYFSKRGQEQINYVNAIAIQKNIEYTVKYNPGLDHKKMEVLDIDIFRKEDGQFYSILKNPYRIKYPMSDYIEQCISNFPNPVHWKENNAVSKEMIDIEFHKAAHKLNDAIMRSSGGRVPALLERLGRAGCRLNVNAVKQV